MANKKISDATDRVTVTSTDILPLARLGSVTAYNATARELAIFALQRISVSTFDGRNGEGACTCGGAFVGNLVVSIFPVSTTSMSGSATPSFESIITVNGQIQQTNGLNLSAIRFCVVLINWTG